MLKQLTVNNLRIVESARLEPQRGINVICGINGSGKTTLLEAVYLLARGRSFRFREAAPLIREGSEQFLLTARICDNAVSVEHQLGMRRTRQEVEVRLDGRPASKRSEILQLLPLQWIGPDPQELVLGSPEVRRSFLDYGLFHVEHRYLNVLQLYNRTLNQRNALLRKGGDGLDQWDRQLSGYAEQLDAFRQDYLSSLKAQVHEYLKRWSLDIGLELSYRKGWSSGLSLLKQLRENHDVDRKQRFTGAGPHRADIVLKSSSLKSGRKLSRGQLKMLVSALHFAQSSLAVQTSNVREILLFDDLSAELDRSNREKLLVEIDKLYEQAFVTSLEAEDLPLGEYPVKVFHVEHGVFQTP